MDKNFKLMVLDVEGTLLNSKNQVDSKTVEAIKTTAIEDKTFAIATGRTLSTLEPYLKNLSGIRYGIIEGGALIYDFWNQKIILRRTHRPDTVRAIVKLIESEKMLVQVAINGKKFIDLNDVKRLGEFDIAKYDYEKYAEKVSNIAQFMLNNVEEIEKISIYHRNANERAKTINLLYNSKQQIEMLGARDALLEIFPLNINKGSGLKELCKIMSISPKNVVAVGSDENDVEFLQSVGLAVAMGNAIPYIKEICEKTVSDNDSGGCAEAIEKFLLG